MRDSGIVRIYVVGQGCPQGSSVSLCAPGVCCPGPALPHPHGALAQGQQILSSVTSHSHMTFKPK